MGDGPTEVTITYDRITNKSIGREFRIGHMKDYHNYRVVRVGEDLTALCWRQDGNLTLALLTPDAMFDEGSYEVVFKCVCAGGQQQS
eukprot:SAG22_NODE_1235_length_5056_cov_5.397216_4_plen_87_part_00